MKKILRIATVVICLVALFAPAYAGGPEVGAKAPDFTLTDANGETHKLSDYEGKIVVLEWTNPGCPFVQYHYKEDTMTGLATAYADKDVVWMAVDSSNFVSAESAQKWAKTEGIEYPILLDPAGNVGKMYDAKTTPDMFIIGADGTLLYRGAIDDDPRISGKANVNYIDAALQATTAGEPVETAKTKPYGCSVKYAKDASATKAAS